MPDVLLVSREAAMAERQTDFLSAKLLRENSSKTRPLLTTGKSSGRRAASRLRGDLSCVCPPHGEITKRRETCLRPFAGTLHQALWSNASELYNTLMRQPTTDMGYAWIRRAFQAVDIGAAEIQQWFAAE